MGCGRCVRSVHYASNAADDVIVSAVDGNNHDTVIMSPHNESTAPSDLITDASQEPIVFLLLCVVCLMSVAVELPTGMNHLSCKLG